MNSGRLHVHLLVPVSLLVMLGACADLGHLAEATRAEATLSALDPLDHRPPGCPEPLPEDLVPEELQALAGRCLLPGISSRFSGPGFVGVGLIDPHVSSDIFIYWHGEVDASTQALIDEAATEGIHVEVRPVPYSEAQMVAAGAAIIRSLDAAGVGVVSISPSFERITVTIVDAEHHEAAGEVAGAAADGIPVTVVVAGPAFGEGTRNYSASTRSLLTRHRRAATARS